MLRQTIKIPKYSWRVVIFYDARPADAYRIEDILLDMDCPDRHIDKAMRLLKSGEPNQGFTYSQHRSRETIIVIGHADNLAEYLNSMSHELTHLKMAICSHFSIDPYGEEAAYLSGDLEQVIAENAWKSFKRLFGR